MPSPLSPYRLVRDLNAQWRRLCDGSESSPTVAAALDVWRRSPVPGLNALGGLDDVLKVIERSPDEVLGHLVAATQAGDSFSGRVIMQALLPKLVLIARSQQRPQASIDELLAEACASLWERVANYPLRHRPHSVAANLALDTLKALRREHHNPEPPIPVPTVVQWLPDTAHVAVNDELTEVLARACQLGIIDATEAQLLERVYRYDQALVCAAELGISAGAIRKRCTLLKARLRPRALELIA